MRKAGLIQVFRYESFVKTYRYMRYFRYHCHPSILSKTVCRIFDSKVQFWMGLLVKRKRQAETHLLRKELKPCQSDTITSDA